MNAISGTLKRALPAAWIDFLRKARSRLFDAHAARSYSQHGEDMILRGLLVDVQRGFYVDVGAYQPKRFSNTYFFYQQGWSGINIDARPGSMVQFDRQRPRDINIEAAVGPDGKRMTYFAFREPAYNSLDREIVQERVKDGREVTAEIEMTTTPLRDVLSAHLPKHRKIHFLSVDVEGLDLEVLQSNDWQTFRPKYVLVECTASTLRELEGDAVYRFLCGHGYALVAKTLITGVFADQTEP